MHRATLATNTGDNLCIGNNPSASGAFMLPGWCFDDFPTITDESIEVRRDRVLSARGLRWAAHHPVDEGRLVLWRSYWTFLSSHDGLRAVQSYEADPWLSTYHGRIENVLATTGDAYWFVTAALAVLGLLHWRRRPDARRSVLAMTTLALAIVVWPFFGDTRFGLPVVALVAFPAASALEVFRRDRRADRSPNDGIQSIAGSDVVGEIDTGGADGGGFGAPTLPAVTFPAVEHPVIEHPVVDDHGEGDEEHAEQDGTVGGLHRQRPAEAGDGTRHDLAGDHVPAGDEHEGRTGEAR
jgi:hypothetical protein